MLNIIFYLLTSVLGYIPMLILILFLTPWISTALLAIVILIGIFTNSLFTMKSLKFRFFIECILFLSCILYSIINLFFAVKAGIVKTALTSLKDICAIIILIPIYFYLENSIYKEIKNEENQKIDENNK